ncbi:FAD-binding protein [Streptomyces sp. NPDC101455]|uniref:FAD-binding protein n=1 Tax=Streptomyces sp. NPDC101455 TaxID=3366142 RepID=UPI0037FEA242
MTHFDGSLLARDSDGYEAARLGAVWNARKPDRHPDLILLAGSDRDVQEGVRLTVARGPRVSVRSGGHSWIGTGVRDGGLLIDLSALDEVTVDAPARRAAAGPAVQGSRLNTLPAERGLVFPSGHCPSVGVGGFLTGRPLHAVRRSHSARQPVRRRRSVDRGAGGGRAGRRP